MSQEESYSLKRLHITEEVVGEITSELEVDCHEGCAYCCFGVTLWLKKWEAWVLCEFLNRLPLKKRKEIAKKLKEYERTYLEEARRVGYTPRQPISEGELDLERLSVIGALGMNEVPCPFLEEGSNRCLVYEARPTMCRLTLYRDSEVCRKDWENPMGFVWKNEIAPFIDRVKERFYPKMNLKLQSLAKEFPEASEMEGQVGFVTHWIRFDPVKKTFKLRA